MKNVRSIRGLAFSGLASLGLFAVAPAFAESDFDSTGPAYAANADLNFSVIIPQFISFRVGSTGGTVDTVEFTVAAANVGDGSDVSRTNAGGAAIPVELISNGGDVSIAATGSGTGLTDGTNIIDWSEIDGTSSNAGLDVPAVGGSVNVTATDGVIDDTADWTFVYDNTDIVAAATYNGTVTYTATDL